MLDINKNNDIVIECIKEYRNSNNISIRNKLIEDCYKSLMRYAGYFYNKYKFFDVLEFEDIMVDTFIEVVERYNIEKNAKFSTYFYIRARGNILDKMRQIQGRHKLKKVLLSLNKRFRSNNGSYALEDYLIDNRVDIESSIIHKDEIESLKSKYMKICNNIRSKRNQKIFIDYYLNNMRISEIGKKFGIASTHVGVIISQINRRYFPERIRKYRKKS